MARLVTRRTALTALLAGAAIPLLAACGGGAPAPAAAPASTSASTTTGTTAAATAAATSAPVAAAGGTTTLRFAFWGSLAESKIWKQISTTFAKNNPSIKLQAQYVTGNYNQKLTVQTAGGTAPDAMLQQSKYLSSFLNWFQPLDSYVAKSKIVVKDQYFPMDWERGAWHGKQYGVPWDSATSQIFYNEDVFKAAGVAPPPSAWDDPKWTWDAFLTTAQKLVKGSGAGKTWGYQPSGWWVYLQPWIWANGGPGAVDKWNNPTACTFDQPAVKEAIGWVVDLSRKYHVAPQPGEMTQGFQAVLSANTLGMWESNTSLVPTLLATKNLKWNVAPYPSGKAGAWVRDPVDQIGLSSSSKQPEAGFPLIEYVTGVEGETLITSLGRGIPSRISVAQSDAFLRPNSPVHWKVFYDAAQKHTKQQALTPVFDWMDRTIGEEYTNLLAGHATLDQFVSTLTPEITAKLLAASKANG